MMPILASLCPTRVDSFVKLRLAAGIACQAARVLAWETVDARDAARYRLMADRIRAQLGSSGMDRESLLRASPALIEGSGRTRTLIEMIEEDSGDHDSRLRLAKILIRALVWLPESISDPGETADLPEA